jgi:hypothetical protein
MSTHSRALRWIVIESLSMRVQRRDEHG